MPTSDRKNLLLNLLWRNRDGMAATEFALLMPMVVMMFFGMLELADGMLVNRRVSITVNAAADLAAQNEQLTPNEIEGLMIGVLDILEPVDDDDVEIIMTSVVLDDNGDPIVHWSMDNDFDNDTEPYSVGAPFTKIGTEFSSNANGLVHLSDHSMIFVEMRYPYTPAFASYFVKGPINFDREAKRVPRLSPTVLLCNNFGNSCS